MKPPTAPIHLAIRAATEIAIQHGIVPDRCDILQNSSTLVIRLTETLVARVVTDVDGPRQGTDWFKRENDVAQHLTARGAPVIPLHPEIPPGPYEYFGYALNFWKYVSRIDEEPEPARIGETLFKCHELLRSFEEPLPRLAILIESIELLDTLEKRQLFSKETLLLLRAHLESSVEILSGFPSQALHGDAHPGNLMNTTQGLLWTDWEDTFFGPAEWDLASIIWNARLLDEDHQTADAILDAYQTAGGKFHPRALDQSLIARAAVMSAWYPVLYPEPSPERQKKLQRRLDWLGALPLP